MGDDKPILPIHEMSRVEFNDFKKNHLDGRVLNLEDLDEMKISFGLGDKPINPLVQSIYCDEAHSHSYSCVRYKSSEAGVVDRLLLEIDRYKARISRMREEVEKD